MESDPFAESCQRLPEIGAGRTPHLIEMGVTEWFCKTFSGDLRLTRFPVCVFGALLNRNEYPTTHWTGLPTVARLQLDLEVHAFAVGTVFHHAFSRHWQERAFYEILDAIGNFISHRAKRRQLLSLGFLSGVLSAYNPSSNHKSGTNANFPRFQLRGEAGRGDPRSAASRGSTGGLPSFAPYPVRSKKYRARQIALRTSLHLSNGSASPDNYVVVMVHTVAAAGFIGVLAQKILHQSSGPLSPEIELTRLGESRTNSTV